MDLLAVTKKAAFGTILFSLAGVISAIWLVRDWQTSLPLLFFYITLVINTYFSIQLFAQITPANNVSENVIDIVLGAIYLFLAWNMSSPIWFTFLATMLFIVAICKYLLLRRFIHQPNLMKRKIRIDIIGTTSCLFAFIGVVAGYAHATTWIWALLFLGANVYWLYISPMYRLDA